MVSPFHHHGGRLSAARAAYPDAPQPWLDLSTGINPEPWSGPQGPADDLARPPDPDVLADLERLAAAGFEPVGANALFRLVRHPDAAARFEALCRAGVLVRPFPHDPTWLRFGLPPAGHWSRLQSALETLP